MELNLIGDYYEWYCDWCDTLNVTLIHRVTDETFHCCACHKQVLCEVRNPLARGRHDCSMPYNGPGQIRDMRHLRELNF